ncbi:MAG: hypothetical protein QOD06_635 [Candidatus Binatota bacterium]|jgi:NAD(P)-dependent dehydrogenase (short-subunit alcohol dehydrogenase family)|nr:hypothetical protein [Candidatus Binatota bacterium]
MEPFRSRVAVVTGGGSGIGRALALAFAREGASVVIADVDDPAMAGVAREIEAAGGQALAVRTDVTRLEEVQALAERTFARFGAAHVICNNAGVGVFGPLASASHRDWQWVMNVNVWGVIHGIEVFLPRLIAQAEGGHIVNTASMAGLAGMPGLGVYCASKFAVVGLTESLHRELAGSGIGASVLCPMIVNTRINASERSRPDELRNADAGAVSLEEAQFSYGRVIEPEEVAEHVLDAIRKNELYVLTHHESRDILQRRADRIGRAAEKLRST